MGKEEQLSLSTQNSIESIKKIIKSRSKYIINFFKKKKFENKYLKNNLYYYNNIMFFCENDGNMLRKKN